MFSISADFTDNDLEKLIMDQVEQWFDELIDTMRKRGRELVDKARAKTKSEGGFNNITWNLRASIGMCIVNEDGKIVETYFPPINKGEHGNKIGRALAQTLAVYGRELKQVVMVFVAGEEYAGFVEAKGTDVIKQVIGSNLADALKEIM